MVTRLTDTVGKTLLQAKTLNCIIHITFSNRKSQCFEVVFIHKTRLFLCRHISEYAPITLKKASRCTRLTQKNGTADVAGIIK